MTVSFTTHTPESAPEAARTTLVEANTRLGFLPNLYAKLAESPAALEGYMHLSSSFGKTALSPIEQQVVLLAVSVENACEFCVAAHSMIAKLMAQAPAPVVAALREGRELPDARLHALAEFTRNIVRSRGFIDDAALERFLKAGFDKRHVLDVVLGVAMKTLSNYANHITHTPLNAQFESERWSAPRRSAA